MFAFRTRTNDLAFSVGEVFVNRYFTTIVGAFEYFVKCATGPPGGTTVAGRDAFGIEVQADVVQ